MSLSNKSVQTLSDKAEQIYIYAFPLVITEITRWGSKKNGLEHYRTFPDDRTSKVVKLNLDTLYSIAFTSLAKTPYILHIPKIEDRYYLFPVMDAYTNVVESIGTRTPEWADGDYILLYQDSPVPAGFENYRVIRLKDSLNSILLRIETRGKKDYKYINELQDRFSLKALYPEKLEEVPPSKGAPALYIESLSPEDFFNLFHRLSVENPVRDGQIRSWIHEFGLDDEEFSFENIDSSLRQALIDGALSGFKKVSTSWPAAENIINSNGWESRFTDIGRYGNNYLARASVSLHGWGANIPEDSAYATASADTSGDPFDSAKKYKIHFKKDGYPHAAVFWSMTLYGERYLAENRIGRYSFNTYDLEDGRLVKNDDGSLDIYISREEPESAKEKTNWLPAPLHEDTFSVSIRIYWPDEVTLQGRWEGPVINEIKD
ncbi:MAG: DUF1214 domain-containing protein [Lachnospiraceae bacterium]|nr:DUF1214 domain-containing protein [Lachnospiraceae bacterium]